MVISVMSPHSNNNGNTTLAMLIALYLANNGKSTCLTHVKPISNSFKTYLNLVDYVDKTSTPSQIVKILKEGDLSKDDISDYCKKVSNNLEVFTNESTSFSQDDMNFMIDYIAKYFPYDDIVFDVDDIDIAKENNLFKKSDVVVLNITQSVVELKNFYKSREEYNSLVEGIPTIVVVNKYNSLKCTLKETANCMGIKKPNKWLVLHENPWICWATNHGKLNIFFKNVMKKDSRVIDVYYDLQKIGSALIRASNAKAKKFGGRKR